MNKNFVRASLAAAVTLGWPLASVPITFLQPRVFAQSKAQSSQRILTKSGTIVASLNRLLSNGLAANSKGYHAYGFTFETSTGKLWWTRSLDKDNEGLCPEATYMFSAAYLSNLDASTLKIIDNPDGSADINIDCKVGDDGKESTCFENWSPAYCNNDWKTIGDYLTNTVVQAGNYPVEVNHFPDSTTIQTAIFSPPIKPGDKSSSATVQQYSNEFRGRQHGLLIRTTGDLKSASECVKLLKLLIGNAVAKTAPSSAR